MLVTPHVPVVSWVVYDGLMVTSPFARHLCCVCIHSQGTCAVVVFIHKPLRCVCVHSQATALCLCSFARHLCCGRHAYGWDLGSMRVSDVHVCFSMDVCVAMRRNPVGTSRRCHLTPTAAPRRSTFPAPSLPCYRGATGPPASLQTESTATASCWRCCGVWGRTCWRWRPCGCGAGGCSLSGPTPGPPVPPSCCGGWAACRACTFSSSPCCLSPRYVQVARQGTPLHSSLSLYFGVV